MSQEKKRRSWRREVLEWGLILLAGAGLYVSGLHVEVIGRLQGLLLQSGILKPEVLEQPREVQGDLLLVGLDGREIRLSELKGKVVFLNVWATWCPPCVAEMPDLARLYKNVQNADLEYIFLSVDDEIESVRQFLARKDLDIPVYFPGSPLPPALSARVIPSTYVFDRRGRIVMERKGMAKYNSGNFRGKLSRYIGENP